jgi:hypothetical protein
LGSHFAFFAIIAFATSAFAASDQQIVDMQYPPALLTRCVSRLADAAPARFSSYARADLDATGAENYIIAAYSNGYCGEVRVMKVADGVVTATFDSPSQLLMEGTRTTIAGRDIDGDGHPELIASFDQRKEAEYWILKWHDGTLIPFQPAWKDKHGNVSSILRDPLIRDVDGDGIDEIALLTPGARYPYTIYYLRDGDWIAGQPAVFSAHCVRTEGEPDDLVFQFGADQPGDTYELLVSNGRAAGDGRVTSAVITLNGLTLFGQNVFKETARTLSATVHVKAENILIVTLDGKPRTEMTVTVRPTGPVAK